MDLCCGRKGASNDFQDNGWDVVTVDINPKFNPTYTADVNSFYIDEKFDFIWASPYCGDYSKFSLPASWACNGGYHKLPDMRLFLNCYRIIRDLKPKFWCIENVSGARPFFYLVIGNPAKKVGSRYIWGDFPPFDTSPKYGKWKLSPTENRSEHRSEIPRGLTKALRLSLELWL